MKNKILLDIKDLRTYFHTFKEVVKAVDDVSLALREGGILGIVGEPGSGKSVTSSSILKLVKEPGIVKASHITFGDKGLSHASERDTVKTRGKGISMVFQGPMTSLNSLYTIQRWMEEVLILYEPQMNAVRCKARCLRLLSSVGIPNPEERLKEYPNQLSGGMRQGVIIAITLATNPRLLIADEPTTTLDTTAQEQILKLMRKPVKEHNTTLILITHNLAVVSQMVDRINVIYCGRLVETRTTQGTISYNARPYAEGLSDSIPKLWENGDRLDYIPGIVPNTFGLPEGCYFTPRYRCCQEICLHKQPETKRVGPDHMAACHFPLVRDKTGREEGK